MKSITARMIRAKGSCYNPCELPGIDNKTKWTLSQWMEYQHYRKNEDAIWVFSQMASERMAREFAIWCAKRCKTNCREIKEYIKAIEGYYIKKTHTLEQMKAANEAAFRSAFWAANEAADRAENEAAFRVAFWAAFRAANEAAYEAAAWAADRATAWAADEAAFWAADEAAFWAAERKQQLARIKRMLKKGD